jgi:hypothetical protein
MKIVDVITNMKKIIWLNLSWTCLNPKDMKLISEELKHCRTLRSLNLSYNSLTFNDVVKPEEDGVLTR